MTEYELAIVFYNADKKINTIKDLRAFLQCGLKEAKDIVEDAIDKARVGGYCPAITVRTDEQKAGNILLRWKTDGSDYVGIESSLRVIGNDYIRI